MTYFGIDVGKNGGIALIEDGVATAYPFSEEKLLEVASSIISKDCWGVVELVHAMPNQGVTSMFHFGENFGFIRGVLCANNLAYVKVSPQTWKKEFGLDSDKQKSIDKCKELYPKVNLFKTPRCKKEHDGMAEAVLMAEFARRKL